MNSNIKTFNEFPLEILLRILKFCDFKDVVKWSLVSSTWNQACKESSLWKLFSEKKWKRNVPSTILKDWFLYFTNRSKKEKKVPFLLKNLGSSEENDKSKALLLDWGMDIMEKLEEILYSNEKEQVDNILSYYAGIMIREINERRCLEDWENLLQKPNKSLEEGATIIAQWEYPLLDPYSISDGINKIAKKVSEDLSILNSNPKSSKPQTDIDNLVYDTFQMEPMEILKIMKNVMYDKLGFSGNSNDYYNPKNSFLNDVLKSRTGIPISLSVLFAAVAKKFGIDLMPIGFPTHFLLGYTPKNESTVYFDAFHGIFLSKEDCILFLSTNAPNIQFSNDFLLPIQPEFVFSRMLKNLLNNYKSSGEISKQFGIMKQIMKVQKNYPSE
jgi:regulator of sirC expression with transglutaminase-like and TPR domain